MPSIKLEKALIFSEFTLAHRHVTDEKEWLTLSSHINPTLGGGTFPPYSLPRTPQPPPPPLPPLPFVVLAMMETETLAIIILAVLSLLRDLGVVQYVSVYVWSRWTVAGVLSSKRDWLISLPDRLNRMTSYLDRRKITTDPWKALLGGFDRDREG